MNKARRLWTTPHVSSFNLNIFGHHETPPSTPLNATHTWYITLQKNRLPAK